LNLTDVCQDGMDGAEHGTVRIMSIVVPGTLCKTDVYVM